MAKKQKMVTEDDLVLLDNILMKAENLTPQEIRAVGRIEKALKKVM